MKKKRILLFAVLLAVFTAIAVLIVSIDRHESMVENTVESPDEDAQMVDPTTVPENEHAQMTKDLMVLLESDSELKALMEKSLAAAAKINPDPDTNPAQSLEQLYDFLDWAAVCMPWNVLKNVEYSTFYEHIDQSVDYFWFLVDQPLEELEGLGYYYPTLQYHEPIASWCRKYADTWGSYLDTPESWNDEYLELFRQDERFGLDKGWYESPEEWISFNDFFARKLSDPSVRPIGETALVAPADSKPQGMWKIDDKGELVQKEGVQIKSANFTSIRQLIGEESKYADAFAGGTLTHTFLDVNDYHRYHFPISGTVLEVRKIEGTNAAGGITHWDEQTGKYVLEDAIPGWQMIETRDCVILDTEYGLVAILPVGMSQICSCNWEDSVQVGAQIEKGDPMGYFLFGGSDIVMVFQKQVKFEMVVPDDGKGGYEHLLMGEPYANLTLE